MKLIKLLALPLSAFLLTGCLEPKLPKCDDKETQQSLFQVINQALKESGEKEQLVSLKDIEQVAFNDKTQIRVCKTDTIMSNAEQGWVTYKIYWGRTLKKGLEKEFFVEITDAGDY